MVSVLLLTLNYGQYLEPRRNWKPLPDKLLSLIMEKTTQGVLGRGTIMKALHASTP